MKTIGTNGIICQLLCRKAGSRSFLLTEGGRVTERGRRLVTGPLEGRIFWFVEGGKLEGGAGGERAEIVMRRESWFSLAPFCHEYCVSVINNNEKILF